MQIEPIHLWRWFEWELQVDDWINLHDNFVITISTRAHSMNYLCVHVKNKQRAQQRLSAREHFYIDRFKGYKVILYRWQVVEM